MSESTSGKLKIVYLAGPGDAASVLRTMARNQDYTEVAHVTYSGQMYEACRALGAELLCISSNKRDDDFSFENLRAINRSDLFPDKTGIAYHLGNFRFAREVRKYASEMQANVIVTATEPYPFLLQSMAKRGVALVPALHAALVPEFKEATAVRKFLNRMSKAFYQKHCAAILSHPGAAARQAQELTDGSPRPIVEFIPLYRKGSFGEIKPPLRTGNDLNIITVGRVEPEKGVFDLIEVARRLRSEGRESIRFDVCGTGSALESARTRVKELNLADSFTLHGWTSMPDLMNLWQQSHLAVIPTTRDFVEGFNQVVIEAMLAGRPVVTSEVCPALDFVRPSCVEVPPEDINAYKTAILQLADDPDHYERLQSRCHDVASQFLNPEKSFRFAMNHILSSIADKRPIRPLSRPPEV